MANTDVATYAASPLNQRIRYAQTLAGAASLIPVGLHHAGQASAAKIMLVAETGAMLGLHPMAAIQGIDVIEGRATISPRLATALIRAKGHKLRFSDSGTIEGGDYVATWTLIRTDDPDEPIVASFTPQMAARANLCQYVERNGVWSIIAESSKGKALPWQQYPEDMCQWRALSRLMRRGAEDVLLGIGYFPDELGATDLGEDGTRVDTLDAEADAIERIRALDDKADMARLLADERDLAHWTDRVDGEFTAHLATVTKDSRPRRPGAPGQTGNADFDAAATEPGATAPSAPEDAPEPQEPAPADSEPVDAEIVEDDDDELYPIPMPSAEEGAEAYSRWLDGHDAWEAEREQQRREAAEA